MEQIEVSDDEGGEEPVSEVDEVVMIKIVPNISPCEFAVIIISVMAFSKSLIESWIEISKHPSSVLGVVVKHYDNKAEVYHSQHSNNSEKSLHWVKEFKMIGLKIREGAKEQSHRITSSPPVAFVKLILSYWITWIISKVFSCEGRRPDVPKCKNKYKLALIWDIWYQR